MVEQVGVLAVHDSVVHRQETLSEENLAVGHIVVGGDGQHPVVGEPNACLGVVERVAVLNADRAVGGKSEVNDTRSVLVSFLDGLQEAGEVERLALVAVCVCKSDAVWVGSVDGFEGRQ